MRVKVKSITVPDGCLKEVSPPKTRPPITGKLSPNRYTYTYWVAQRFKVLEEKLNLMEKQVAKLEKERRKNAPCK
jgi:cell division protein YceG involved in septum cleavage